jgi:hypothetical protein
LKFIDVSGIRTANTVSDFNEVEYKKFASRTGDKWSFFIPPGELQGMEDLYQDYVLVVENHNVAIGCEIMCGKLVKKVGKGLRL